MRGECESESFGKAKFLLVGGREGTDGKRASMFLYQKLSCVVLAFGIGIVGHLMSAILLYLQSENLLYWDETM